MQAVNGGEAGPTEARNITFCLLYSTSACAFRGTGPANPCEGFNFFELHMGKRCLNAFRACFKEVAGAHCSVFGATATLFPLSDC